MITVRVFSEGKLHQGGLELLELAGPKWIDVEGPTAEKLAPLAQRFGLHPLAVEDCLHFDQRPKLEEYPNHLLLVMQGLHLPSRDVAAVEVLEMHFLLGPDWLITVHDTASAAVAAAAKRMNADPGGTLGRGADFAVYQVADALVDTHFPLMDLLADELEELETDVFARPDPSQLQRIFELKRMLVVVRRVLSPQRDVVLSIARGGLPFVQERSKIYFRDVYDHLVRLYEQIDAARDLLGASMEGYLSVIANRTNDITKQLTIFATIFLPLSFVTGFFGQNFEVLSNRGFFWLMLGTILLFPIALVLWFRRKGWIGR